MPRDLAARALDRYGLAKASEQTFDSLSGGQQARLQILLLELSGATLLLLDEPTDNLDLHSAEALEDALDAFEGTVLAVTHDRWFARGFDRFLVFRRRRPGGASPTSRSGTRAGSAGSAEAPGTARPGRRRLSGPGGRTTLAGMDPQRNKAVTLDAVAALNRGDVEGYLAIYAPGAVVHGLPEHVTPDPAGHRDVLADIRRALPDFRAEVDDVVAEGALLAARVTYTGTHRGPMMGVSPTGRVLTWRRDDVPPLRRRGEGRRALDHRRRPRPAPPARPRLTGPISGPPWGAPDAGRDPNGR